MIRRLLLIAFLFAGCVDPGEREPPLKFAPQTPAATDKLKAKRPLIPLHYERRGTMVPRAVVLHSTSGKGLYSTIRALEERRLAVHLIVDGEGVVYQIMESLEEKGRAARGMDDFSIHLCAIDDNGEPLTRNIRQIQKIADLLKFLCAEYNIPVSNFDIGSSKGVFSHMQAKYRFGGFLPNDKLEPGEEFTRMAIERAGGKYFPEEEWKGRYDAGWTLVREREESNAKRGELTKGRGLTPTPEAQLKSVERMKDGRIVEGMRLRYVDRGKIEIRGVVLHFTATADYKTTIATLEDRRLCSTIIVDTDGSAYQVMDSLDEKPAAAGGTNEYCVQIEIVGKDESALLANKIQTEKVADILRELCKKFNIPNDNHDIGSLRGIFSHGQAKKRFGRSAWLWGDEFDPGETYMERVIGVAGGTYYRERDWKDRAGGDWIFLFDDWSP